MVSKRTLNLKFLGLPIYHQQFGLSQLHIIFSPLSWINLDYMTFINYLVIYSLKKKTVWITWYAYYTILRNRALTIPGTDLHKFKQLLTHDVRKWSYASSIWSSPLTRMWATYLWKLHSLHPWAHRPMRSAFHLFGAQNTSSSMMWFIVLVTFEYGFRPSKERKLSL